MLQALRTIFLDDPRQARAFVTGPADVLPSDQAFGLTPETYQPPEYVDYPATSNDVYACISVRASNLSGLPLKIYRGSQRTEVESGPLYDLLHKVNPYWTLNRLLEMTEQSLCVWGECFWFFERDSRGRPVEIWWARADRVTVHPHPTGYVSHFTYEVNGKRIEYRREETIWFRYPNIANQWQGLSPLAAARLAADSANAAMKANYGIYRNGIIGGGIVHPKSGENLTKEQAETVADHLNQRFSGVKNAHRVGVLRFDVDMKQLSMTPKDAEFLALMNLSLEQVARAFRVPIDKIGGRRTYQNVEESERVFWADCIVPEATFIAGEITEQLLPLFGPDYVAEFDLSGVDALSEGETDEWERWKGQIETGVRKINEYREAKGLKPVPWGDVWWAQSTLIPIDSEEKPQPAMPMLGPGQNTPQNVQDGPEPEQGRTLARNTRTIAYGSPEHVARWQRQIERQEPWEQRFGTELARLMADQRQSILAHLRQRGARNAEALSLDPFDRGRWIKAFRLAMRPLTEDMTINFAELARDELGFGFAFDVQDPRIIRAIETQVQRFVEEVTETTWNALRESIRDGIEGGETIDQIADRIEEIMRDRIRSSKETIARTEVARASNTGTLEAWRQSGVVTQKQWLAAIDDRTRATHVEAHGQVVGIGENFRVGSGEGPTPGQLGIAREDINCRCTMVAVLDVEAQQSNQPKPQPRPLSLDPVDDDLVTVIVEGGL